MSSESETSARDPLDLLVEQFLAARRTDAKLTVDAFAAAHPAHAAELRDLLPTIVALEDHKRERASSGSGRRRASVPQLERLGEFRIVREVGRGGMGVVFEAMQESLGRKVALKVLPQAALLTGNQLERFRREAQIAAQLHHSNIVPVFGSGESDGYHWYAMQFIVGQSLDGWRDEQTAAPPAGSGAWKARARFVARLGVQAAAALHYAHGVGTLHRDVKPGNLLLEPNDHLWVTDFGLAKALEAEGLTHSGDLLGTLQYMAPEQFAGSYDVRSEVYALGVTLYELLTLRPAFAGSSRSELMERIRTLRPEPLRKSCPELPEDLAVVVEKAMARDPADRYADAGELADDLQAFLDDRAIAARRLSTTAVVWRWCRRNRGMAALAASTFVAVVGAGITGWVANSMTNAALVQTRTAEAEAVAQAKLAAQQWGRADKNLQLSLEWFGKVFDALVGPDPALAFDEDEETGEQTVVVRSAIDPRDIALLQKLLDFYDQFAAENEQNQSLQLEAARACRRVGAIRVRFGEPDDLALAAGDYEQALARLDRCSGDVVRDKAAVLVEYSQLERRLGRQREADLRLQAALQAIAAATDGGARAVRFDRARILFLSGQRGERLPGVSRVRDERAREQLELARDICIALLAEDADNAECRALLARCLLALVRMGFPESAADRRDAMVEAIGILRDLVATHPQTDQYRYELTESLLGLHRRELWPRTRTVVDVAQIREAAAEAEKLVQAQPRFVEYQVLYARARSMLGAALVDTATSRVGPNPLAELSAEQLRERQGVLREAEAELLAALQAEADLVRTEAAVDRRLVVQLLATRVSLAGLYWQTGRREDCGVQIDAILQVWEQQLLERRPPFADLGIFDELVRRLGDGDRLSRWARLRERLQSEAPPNRRPR